MERIKDPSPEIVLETEERTFILTWYNAIVFVFEKDPEMNHVYFSDGENTYALFDNQQILDNLLEHGFPLYSSTYAPDHDVEAYLRYQHNRLEIELDEL